jgi:Rrf2 family transcriptional regulator, nitric oxide-sensitive transcriptional repressor
MSRSDFTFLCGGNVISQTVEYSLRAVVALAQRGGQPCTAQQISKLTEVPGPYLAKLMQGLVRAGLVHSRRGLHGGFVLAKKPQELTIWDVVDAVEPFQRIRTCPLRIGDHSTGLCPLHRRLDDAMETVERSFRATTVAELLNDPGGRTPLCERAQLVTLDSQAPFFPQRR